MWSFDSTSASRCRPASVVAVPEILGAAQAGVSFAFNPTPLTLGALAYLVLFLPVVVLGRWVETRFAWKR